MKTLNIIFALSLFSSVTLAQTEGSGQARSTKNGGGAAAASYAATGKAIGPGPAKQTQGKTFGERVNAGLATNHSGAIPATTSSNPLYQGDGNAQVNPLHKGESKAASPGNPIGGIIVKGGRKD